MARRGSLTEEAWGAVALPVSNHSGRCALVWPFRAILNELHMIRQTRQVSRKQRRDPHHLRVAPSRRPG